MMVSGERDPALVERLKRLGGKDSSCCVPEYQGLAHEVLNTSSFHLSLRGYKALADENRLLALALLKRRKELCACEIQAATGLTHATVSHHMSLLAETGIVSARRRGKWMYYRLNEKPGVKIP